MTCPSCGGSGFVIGTIDFTSSQSNVVTKGVKAAIRCPEYLEYFSRLKQRLGIDDPNVSKGRKLSVIALADTLSMGCDAAILAHKMLRDREAAKEQNRGER